MPRHVINRNEWDTFLLKLEREDDEKIVSVIDIGDGVHLEVLTQDRDRVERR